MYGNDGNDTLVFGMGEGLLNTFDGGVGWTDTIQLQDVDGGAGVIPVADWTLVLSQGSVQSTNADSYDLSADSAGTIIMADGSELTFSGVEKIEW
jgi:hypothetical protein